MTPELSQATASLLGLARAIEGLSLSEVARRVGVPAPGTGVRHKGRVGTLIERALGATAGSAPGPDFPELGVELKTVPVDEQGHPYESTFVCCLRVADADRAEWATSTARAKLSHVLWVPVVGHPSRAASERRVGRAVLWTPTPEQEGVLRDDFEEIVGRIGAGDLENLTARAGQWLQLRPKAQNGSSRTVGFGPEGEWIETVPRGLYLRATFTRALLASGV